MHALNEMLFSEEMENAEEGTHMSASRMQG